MAVRVDPDGVEIEAIRKAAKIHGKRVLEVGCGDGWLAEALADEAKGYVAIDIDEKMIERAKRRNTPAEFRVQDLFDVEEYFDIVIAVRTIHEVSPESQELALKKLLNIGNSVVLLEPTPGSEVQSLYDICLLQRNIDHRVRVSSFYTTLYKLLENEEAKLKKIDLVRAPWHADNPEELARFIVEDEETPEVLDQVIKKAEEYWNKHPGAIYDESILVIIEKI